jgi:hypothetical protein
LRSIDRSLTLAALITPAIILIGAASVNERSMLRNTTALVSMNPLLRELPRVTGFWRPAHPAREVPNCDRL